MSFDTTGNQFIDHNETEDPRMLKVSDQNRNE